MRSNRTTQHPVRLGSSTASHKCTKPSPKMGGKCSCEDRKKLADFEKKVSSLEKLISDHTRKTSHSLQITHRRSSQINMENNLHQGWRSLKRSSMEVVNQASNKRMKVNDSKIVTITLDESDSDNDVEIIEQRIKSRKTATRMYFDKPKTSTIIKSKYNEEASRLIAMAHGN